MNSLLQLQGRYSNYRVIHTAVHVAQSPLTFELDGGQDVGDDQGGEQEADRAHLRHPLGVPAPLVGCRSEANLVNRLFIQALHSTGTNLQVKHQRLDSATVLHHEALTN